MRVKDDAQVLAHWKRALFLEKLFFFTLYFFYYPHKNEDRGCALGITRHSSIAEYLNSL